MKSFEYLAECKTWVGRCVGRFARWWLVCGNAGSPDFWRILSKIQKRLRDSLSKCSETPTKRAPKVLVGDPWFGCMTETDRPRLLGRPMLGLEATSRPEAGDLHWSSTDKLLAAKSFLDSSNSVCSRSQFRFRLSTYISIISTARAMRASCWTAP